MSTRRACRVRLQSRKRRHEIGKSVIMMCNNTHNPRAAQIYELIPAEIIPERHVQLCKNNTRCLRDRPFEPSDERLSITTEGIPSIGLSVCILQRSLGSSTQTQLASKSALHHAVRREVLERRYILTQEEIPVKLGVVEVFHVPILATAGSQRSLIPRYLLVFVHHR